jgi:phosphatidylserine/phosphatidylglycerophosphate/cardiolipin synthase-like enzyme
MKTDIPQLYPWFGTTMRQMLTAADRRGVQIRVMLPENAGGFGETVANTFRLGNNTMATQWISSLSNGAGILDGRTLLEGTHHQKVLIVKRGDQLTAFCGGVDVNPDRVQATGHGAPLHDVHCRVRGPAAWDVLQIFIERWNDYVGSIRADIDEERRYLTRLPALLGQSTSPPSPCGKLTVQVARTYGRGRTFSYDFAPQGERSIMALISKAIQSSMRFIYFEDQYLVSMYLAGLIREKLTDLRHVTILVTPAKDSDLPEGVYRRKLFIEELRKGGEDKVRVFCPTKACTTCGTYVHAKTWIFDDKFAIIGSANCNRRGLTHDSEASVGIFDASDDSRLTYCFAHRLRIKLWAHHLGIDDAEGHAELADGVACADNWLRLFRPSSARIDDYDIMHGAERVHTDFDWNHAYDCDGS